MAITNAQQFKQLQLVKSRKDGKRPGYYGADAGFGDDNYKDASADFDAGSGRGGSDADFARARSAIADRQAAEQARIEKERFERAEKAKKQALELNKSFLDRTRDKLRTDFIRRTKASNLKDLGVFGKRSKMPGFLGAFIDATDVPKETDMFDIDSIREIASTKKGGLSNFESDTLGDLREDIEMENALEKENVSFNEFQNYLNRNRPLEDVGGEGGQPIIPIIPQGIMAQASSNMDQKSEQEDSEEEGLRLAFRAEGGPIGGEYDFESARQMYGLGKLVKKVTRTVKKIAKSPIGKAALIGGGLGLAGIGPFKGLQTTPFGSSLSNFFGRNSFNPLKAIAGSIDTVSGLDAVRSPFGELISKIPGGGVTAGIVGASALAGFLTPEQEEEAQTLADSTGIDIEQARNSILAARRDDYKMDFRARGFRAEGGPAEGKEPVAKKTMPLLDMDGKEMDLRAEGGFVPIGRMEKADDVPARLSKNEFVFTADAVRNAGEGDVDKGAEVMYNMMKNLESGGEVSEESQGLEGARKMFQTSQRLEEVL